MRAGVLFTASLMTLALAGAASAQTPPPLRAGGVIPGYHYASAYTQLLAPEAPAAGVAASFTVHRPGDVRRNRREHSLAEIAVHSSATHRSYVEAGWQVFRGGPPRLFVFRWDRGDPKCYDFGCGFHDRGPGKRPGSKLKVGSAISLAWVHINGKWWLYTDGERSGFYRDRLWHGGFPAASFASVYGEVRVNPKHRFCADMGNGLPAADPSSAAIFDVGFFGGPPVTLSESFVDTASNYTLQFTAANAFHYGGPGPC